MLKSGKHQQAQQHTKNKYFYTWNTFIEDTDFLANNLASLKFNFKNIYGIPRGGLILATILSHKLELPLILSSSKISAETLVVDDISDSGKTLEKIIKNKHVIVATLWTTENTKVTPYVWCRIKTTKWIIFPWENDKQRTNC